MNVFPMQVITQVSIRVYIQVQLQLSIQVSSKTVHPSLYSSSSPTIQPRSSTSRDVLLSNNHPVFYGYLTKLWVVLLLFLSYQQAVLLFIIVINLLL